MSRVGAFVAGLAVSLAFSQYQLQAGLHNGLDALDQSVRELKADTLESQKVLRKRVAALEAELAVR